MTDRPKIHLVFFGEQGHGKSTLIGRLLFETGQVSNELLERYMQEAAEVGKQGVHFAWVMDQSPQERKLGYTTYVRFRDFNTSKYTIWAVDTPGHDDHVDRVAVGLSEADVGILIVAANQGGTSRTEEHSVLARMLGVQQLIVAITKIDLVDYSERYINRLIQELQSLLLEIGYSKDQLTFVPVSALIGENIENKSEALHWFNGPSLLRAFDLLNAPQKLTSLPFRLPIDTVFYKSGVGTIVCGKIATGIVRKGDQVVFEPGGVIGSVHSIEEVHQERPQFEAGDNVGILVDGIDSSQVDVGYVMGHSINPPISNSWFTAKVNILHYKTRLYEGQTLTLLVHAARVPITIESIMSKLDPKTEKVLNDSPQYLRTLDKGIIQFRTHRPVVIEPPSVVPQLSRFVLRESNRTIAAGVRLETE
ncbi:MAG: GTP-binding protein [Chloroflexota bacterium]